MPGKETGEEGNEDFPSFPGLTDEQRRELTAISVYPTFLFALSAGTVVWYQLEPTAHDRMRLRIHILTLPETRDALGPEGLAALTEQVRFIHLEDIPANEGPWRGLHAGMTAQGRLSPYEKAIWQLNQLWADRVLP